jgi:hypothetical protein
MPSYGAPWTLVDRQVCTSSPVATLVSGSAGSASTPHAGATAQVIA